MEGGSTRLLPHFRVESLRPTASLRPSASSEALGWP